MRKVKLEVSRKPGKISIDNLAEAEAYIKEAVKPFENVNYKTNVQLAKHNKKLLVKLKTELEAAVKEAVRVYEDPLEKMKFDLLKLESIINIPLANAENTIAEFDLCPRKRAINGVRAAFEASSAPLGDYAEAVFASPAFVDEKWLKNPSVQMSTRRAIEAKIEKIADDITLICSSSPSFAPVMLAKYFENLSLDEVEDFKNRVLTAANGSFSFSPVKHGDRAEGRAHLTLKCSEEEFSRVTEWLSLSSINHSIDGCSFVSSLKERKEPDFDSFVAIDIETTGTFGAASGDKPSEITEIGAVKVVNGEIVDTFSMLANPGRKITPAVVKLTHITDEMVRDKPPVSEVVAEFARFAGDSILVGHGIGPNDLSYICRTAEKVGIKLENEYFDTCELALSLKEKYGWQRVKLEYLSSVLGIEQTNAHRASCDAEANAKVYLIMKSLCGK